MGMSPVPSHCEEAQLRSIPIPWNRSAYSTRSLLVNVSGSVCIAFVITTRVRPSAVWNPIKGSVLVFPLMTWNVAAMIYVFDSRTASNFPITVNGLDGFSFVWYECRKTCWPLQFDLLGKKLLKDAFIHYIYRRSCVNQHFDFTALNFNASYWSRFWLAFDNPNFL